MNVALTVAETAYFMEKGEIRFSGATADLLERPDLLRSVFLEGAGRAAGTGDGDAARAGPRQGGRATATTRTSRVAGARARRPATSTRSFGGVRAVDDVSLDVAPGEVVGIIGPNGAGKTTLFDVISGFTPDDGGRILLAGHDITRPAAEPAGPARPRPLVPGRPPVPGHDRRRGAGREPRALRHVRRTR